MTRFISLRATDPVNLPGERLRLEYDTDAGPFLHHERVLRGHELKPDAVIRETFATIPLDESVAIWLHEAIAEMCNGIKPDLDGVEQGAPDPAEEIAIGVDGKFDKGGCK